VKAEGNQKVNVPRQFINRILKRFEAVCILTLIFFSSLQVFEMPNFGIFKNSSAMIIGKILKIIVPPMLVCTLFWVSQFLDAFTIKLVKCLIKDLKRDRKYE